MSAPITLESLKKSATSMLVRKYAEIFGEIGSELTRADMISALWQHYSENGEELPEPVTNDDPHYGEDDEESREIGEKYHRILTAGEVRLIRELRTQGTSFKKIAESYGVSHTFIRNVILRRLYKDVK